METGKGGEEPPAGYQKSEIPGVFNRWGLPWAYENCPCCGKRILRSRHLENRLREIFLRDKIAYELCDDCRAGYGGTFEVRGNIPRNKIEWHVGRQLVETEWSIRELEEYGIPRAYSVYCAKYYQERPELF